MWSEEERKLAGTLTRSKDMMAFLKKVYCPIRSKVRNDIESVIAMPDEVYGQQMKALVMSEKHFADAHSTLARIATKEKIEGEVENNTAPK